MASQPRSYAAPYARLQFHSSAVYAPAPARREDRAPCGHPTQAFLKPDVARRVLTRPPRSTGRQPVCVHGSHRARGCPCPSPDVRCGHPALHSLDAGCASASCLRWPATPAPGHGQPLAASRSTGFQPVCVPCSTGFQPVAHHPQVANLSYERTSWSVATHAARALTPSRRVPVKPCAGIRVRPDQERRPPPRAPSAPARR